VLFERTSAMRFPLAGPLAALLLAVTAAAGQASEHTLVFDLSPFTPPGVGGEVFGVSSVEGEVIHARMDVTLVSNESGPWSMGASFVGFPMGGAIGFHNEVEGWSGTGTFTTVIESDALNGTLEVPDGAPYYSWFLSWAGGALAGAAGEPVLTGTGSLCSGEPATMRLANALAGSATHLVAGFSFLEAAFKGGVLVPSPDVFVLGMPVDGLGVNEIVLAWPAGVPSGFTFWLQHWISDPAGPAGFAASNAVSGTTP
jgi:hypothetical protein